MTVFIGITSEHSSLARRLAQLSGIAQWGPSSESLAAYNMRFFCLFLTASTFSDVAQNTSEAFERRPYFLKRLAPAASFLTMDRLVESPAWRSEQ